MQILILALSLFFQSFVACRQDQKTSPSVAAGLDFPSIAARRQAPENTVPATTDIVFQSTDGGQTWQDAGVGLPGGLGVGHVFADGNEIYLASPSGLYHRSTALVAPVWEKEPFLDEEITDIFPAQNGLFACSYRNGFFKGIPGTGIWKSMHNTLEDKTVRAVLETADGAVFVGCESGIFKSADDGNSWKQVFAGDGINGLAASGDALICGSYGGLLRSTDGGEHWDRVLTGNGPAFKTKRIEGGFITVTGGGPWQDAKKNRLLISADNGKTWQRVDEGLLLVRDIYDVAQAGKYLFCSTDAGISRSSDGGKTWELMRPRADDKEMFHLAVSGQMIFAVLVVGC